MARTPNKKLQPEQEAVPRRKKGAVGRVKRNVTARKKADEALAAQAGEVPVKRRVGRPRKVDPESPEFSNVVFHGPGTIEAYRARLAAMAEGTSTRDLIMRYGREIFNRRGVFEFRLEDISRELSLSIGNITYHFKRKEDLAEAVWEEYLTKSLEIFHEKVTPLFDLKQLFLYFRKSATRAFDYAGVVAFYMGDTGAHLREEHLYADQLDKFRKLHTSQLGMLEKTGYLALPQDTLTRELTFESIFLSFRWWINHALHQVESRELDKVVDKYAIAALTVLSPHLTPSGREQFDHILKLFK